MQRTRPPRQRARGISADVVGAAQLVAAFVTISPFVGRKWRRAGALTVTVMIVMRLVVASGTSTHVSLVLLGGATIGSAVLLAFGRPTTRPRLSSIIDALRSSGIPVAEMHPASVDARGSVPYFATLDDGSQVFAKVLGADQRAADLLFRIYRMVHLRNVGDERPFSSLRRTVEHEALVALQARDVGVRTPRLRCVAPVGNDSFLLCYDMIDGSSLDGVDEDQLTDHVLVGLWEQVALLRQYRIAHRDLRLANVFLSDDGEPWLIDFGFSEIAASETLLRADVAQLIASLSVAVGAERAVAPAIEVLGADAVSGCLGRLQPAALSGATQTDLKAHKGLLEQVRSEIEQRCDRRGAGTRAGHPLRREADLHPRHAGGGLLLPDPAVRRPPRHRHPGQGRRLEVARADPPGLGRHLPRRHDGHARRRAQPDAGGADRRRAGRLVVRQQGRPRRARRHGDERPLHAAPGRRHHGGHLVGRPERRRRDHRPRDTCRAVPGVGRTGRVRQHQAPLPDGAADRRRRGGAGGRPGHARAVDPQVGRQEAVPHPRARRCTA